MVDDCTYIVLTPARDVYAEATSKKYLEDFGEVAPGAVAAGRTCVLLARVGSATGKVQGIGQLGMFDLGRRYVPVVMFRTEVGESVGDVKGLRALLMKSRGPPPSTFVAEVDDAGGAAAAAADARALPIARNAAGKRFGDLTNVADASGQPALEGWVFDGPLTAFYVVKEIAGLAGGPFRRHMTWKREYKLQEDEHIAVALELPPYILGLATGYDQVDISNLAGMECSRLPIQYIEQGIKKEKEAVKDYDARSHYLGRCRRSGGAIVSPKLLEWVANTAARDSAVLKEERKAAGERALARAPEKP